MKINKHGLKMIGLKKAAGETFNSEYYSPEYLEMFYDIATGEIWTIYQYCIGHNTWTEYHSEDIIKLGNIYQKMTMQEISDMICERLLELRERGLIPIAVDEWKWSEIKDEI